MTREQKRQQNRKLRHFVSMITTILFLGSSVCFAVCAMHGGDLSEWILFFAVIGVATVTLLIMRLVLWIDGVKP